MRKLFVVMVITVFTLGCGSLERAVDRAQYCAANTLNCATEASQNMASDTK